MLGGEDGGEGAEDALGDEHHGVAAVLGAVQHLQQPGAASVVLQPRHGRPQQRHHAPLPPVLAAPALVHVHAHLLGGIAVNDQRFQNNTMINGNLNTVI